MIRTLTFEKDPDGRWYVILPEWEGDRADLEMVGNADKLCDLAAQGENKVTMSVSDQHFVGADVLHFIEEGKEEAGAYYLLVNFLGQSYGWQVWLCDVLKFVFGNFPKQLWIH